MIGDERTDQRQHDLPRCIRSVRTNENLYQSLVIFLIGLEARHDNSDSYSLFIIRMSLIDGEDPVWWIEHEVGWLVEKCKIICVT